MIYSVKQLWGYKLGALDGEIGHIKGFYFDDKDWVIRYVVVDTGSWMPGRVVIISSYAVEGIYAGGKVLEVGLTRAKVENSPLIAADLPVARQQEAAYCRYYNWPAYWSDPELLGINTKPPGHELSPEEEAAASASRPGFHLRSAQQVIGYSIQGMDSEIGRVEDFLIDDANWSIRSLVAATGHWWSGKNVLVPSQSIQRVSWGESKVFVNLSRLAVLEEPEYISSVPGPGDHDPRIFR
jgi:hypothetical protein